MRYLIFFFMRLFGFLLLLVSSCAQPVTPTGGEKDNNPPIIKSTNPPNNSANISPKYVEFFFDENIQIKNPEKEIFISPATDTKVKFSKTNKSLKLYIQDPQPHTTYTIALNNSISDLNEGNPGQYPAYLFSTGNTIDTLLITGKINFPDDNNPKNLKVKCSNNLNDTIWYSNKINDDNFTIYGLDTNRKTIVVFNDENNNHKPDTLEDLAFINNISPLKTDTNSLNIYHTIKPNINIGTDSLFSMVYGPGPVKLNASSLQLKEPLFCHDTMYFLTSELPQLIKTFSNKKYITKIDNKEIDNKLTQYLSSKNINDSLIVTIQFNKPVNLVKADNIELRSAYDTITITPTIQQTNKSTIEIKLSDTFLNYSIYIHEGLATYNSIFNHSYLLNLSESANCTFEFQNRDTSIMIGRIFNRSTTREIMILPGSTESIYVSQGTYDCIFWKDFNTDYLITAPDLINQTQGEPYFRLNSLKATSKFINTIVLPPPNGE